MERTMVAYATDVIHQMDITEWTKIEYDGTESDLFRQVGEMLLSCKVPAKIVVNANGGQAVLDVKARGTYINDKGEVLPSIHVTGTNTIETESSEYKDVVLTCVHPQSNNYKAYELLPQNGAITARYESIDKFFAGQYRTVKDPYPSWMFWILYYEKLSKGYVDQSNLVVGKKKVNTEAVKSSSVDESLYAMLMRYANRVCDETFVNKALITENMVRKAKSIYKQLSQRKTVNGFNSQLKRLIAVCPRKRDWMRGDKVMDFMAKSTDDFESILDREENLIMAMDAVSTYEEGCFKAFDIDVFKATPDQKAEVLGYLPPTLKGKVKEVYRVKPLEQEKVFAEYCKKNNIRTIKKLWHGSKNENWASIVKTSLNLSHGTAHGRMFGDGLYFAPDAHKSFNYTSFRGTTWARGNDSVGFMALFATAYGNPCMTHSYGDRGYNQSSLKSRGYDCVHATSQNTGLRADEIIFYSPEAVCMNYLVQFE